MVVVYKDRFTKDELISDAYKQEPPFGLSEICGVGFEVLSKRVTKGGESYGIEDNDEEGGLADTVETVLDVPDKFRLVEVTFSSKKEFLAYMKKYMENVKAVLDEKETENFMNGCKTLVKQMFDNFSDYQFYFGEEYLDHYDDCKAQPVCCYCKDGDETPRFVFFKHGLIEEKF